MQSVHRHIAFTLCGISKIALLIVFLLCASVAVRAQNTKGDRPAASNKKQTRESRFKTKSKKGDKAKTKDIAGRRLRTKNYSSASKANTNYPTPRYATKSPRNGKEREGKSYRPTYSSTPRESERNYSGSRPAKRVAVRSSSASTSKRNVYPQRGTRSVSSQTSRGNIYTGRKHQFVNNPSPRPRDSERITSGDRPKKRIVSRSATTSKRNVYPQRATRSVSSQSSRRNVYTGRKYQFVNNPSPKPRDSQGAAARKAARNRVKVRSVTSQVKKQNSVSKVGGSFKNFRSSTKQAPVSNRSQIARAKRFGTKPSSTRGKATVTPRSASHSFIRNKSTNPYAGFFRVKRKGEISTDKDLAGRPLRTRNYKSAPQSIKVPERDIYSGRKQMGDKPYKGQAGGFHKSATRTQPRAWSSDIAGRKIRGRNYVTKDRPSNRAIYAPRLAKEKVGDHPQHNKIKYGGHVSYSSRYLGKVGRPIPVKTPGKKADKLGRYQANLRGQKPYKGGGSVSGRRWNNAGQPISPRAPGIGANGIDYAGRQKASKPVKGGGSVSGRVWNNAGQPIPGRTPGIGSRDVGYSGNIKASKPLKGGGSVSGRVWNNAGQPIPGRTPGIGSRDIGYSGNIKASKPLKGGGSVSGRVWNNNGQPLPGRSPSSTALKTSGYPGHFKREELYPVMSNQGEEFTGFQKRKKYQASPYQHARALLKKEQKGAVNADGLQIRMKQPGWARNENAHKDALLKRDPGGNVFKTGGLQVPVQSPGYTQNKNAHNASAMKRKPSKESMLVDNLTIKMKQPGWTRNKNAHEDALMKKDPGSNVFRTDGLQIRVQSPGYTQNKNAHDASIMKRKPSKGSMVVDNLTIKTKQPGWARNKNAHEDALMKRDLGSNFFRPDGLQIRVPSPGYTQNKNAHDASIMKRKPGSGVYKTNDIYGRIQAYTYKANPSSSRAALRVREPGKAFAKANNYQGNIKMQKFNFLKHPDYHPDSYFVKTNKNNVKEERSLFTNIRLTWAKLFRKNETQPESVKEKVRKPRYDRREVGLWYD